MHNHGPVKAVHNMVVVGERRIFLSHLPMFMPPHDMQVILETTFVKQGHSVDDVYFADRAKNKAVRFYTLQPRSFALAGSLAGDSDSSALTRFTATVFRGHLEKGARPSTPSPTSRSRSSTSSMRTAFKGVTSCRR